MPKIFPNFFFLHIAFFQWQHSQKLVGTGRRKWGSMENVFFPLFFFSWNEGDIYKIWTEVFFVDWEGGRNGCQKKTATSRLTKKKKIQWEFKCVCILLKQSSGRKVKQLKAKTNRTENRKKILYIIYNLLVVNFRNIFNICFLNHFL